MKKESLDWLEASLFLMLANAEITDYHLSEDEIDTIKTKIGQLVVKVPETSFSVEELAQKFDKTCEWYNTLGELAPQGEMDSVILEEIKKCANFLKKQTWFTLDFAQYLIDDLIDVAEADGEVIKDEQHIINKIAVQWNLNKPF